MEIELKELYRAQSELDDHIHAQHNLNYEITRDKRIMALLVEIGELANETRCFKYWSLKAPSPQNRIIDELADGLHFFLSLGLDLKCLNTKYEIAINNLSLTAQFLRVYDTISILANKYTLASYYQSFQEFLNLIPKLKLTVEEVVEGYYHKLAVNHQRQNEKY